jgi:hypothetical protein
MLETRKFRELSIVSTIFSIAPDVSGANDGLPL